MSIDEVFEKTKQFNPTLYTEPCEEYPNLKKGDAVLDFNEDLAIMYEGGEFRIFYMEDILVREDLLPELLQKLNA